MLGPWGAKRDHNLGECLVRLNYLSHQDLFAQIELHESHLIFLQDNDMCTPTEKAEIVGKVKEIYKVITKNHNINKDVS